MIRFITHNNIDKIKWDSCIDSSINALPYAYSWYLDVVAQKKWDAFILDDYAAVFPVPYHRKYLVKTCYQPLFTQQLGLFSPDPEIIQSPSLFIDMLRKKYFKYYLHLNTYNTVIDNVYKRITQQVALSRTYESVYENYSSVVKNNLNRFGKGVYEIVYSTNTDAIVNFTINSIGEKVKGLSENDYNRLQQLLDILIDNKKGFVVSVMENNSELLASAFIIRSNNRLIYLMAASTQRGRKVNAMTALIDDVFKKYIQSEYIFDFEGSMIPGINNFYKKFGAETIAFDIIKK